MPYETPNSAEYFIDKLTWLSTISWTLPSNLVVMLLFRAMVMLLMLYGNVARVLGIFYLLETGRTHFVKLVAFVGVFSAQRV